MILAVRKKVLALIHMIFLQMLVSTLFPLGGGSIHPRDLLATGDHCNPALYGGRIKSRAKGIDNIVKIAKD